MEAPTNRAHTWWSQGVGEDVFGFSPLVSLSSLLITFWPRVLSSPDTTLPESSPPFYQLSARRRQRVLCLQAQNRTYQAKPLPLKSLLFVQISPVFFFHWSFSHSWTCLAVNLVSQTFFVFPWLWHLCSILLMYFVECPSIWILLRLSRDYTEVIHF